MDYKIEKNLPVSDDRWRGCKHWSKWYNLKCEMELGDSVILPYEDGKRFASYLVSKNIKCVRRRVDSENTRVWKMS